MVSEPLALISEKSPESFPHSLPSKAYLLELLLIFIE